MQYSALYDAEKIEAARVCRWSLGKRANAVRIALGLAIGFSIGCLIRCEASSTSAHSDERNAYAQDVMELFGDKLDQLGLHPADLGETTLGMAWTSRMAKSQHFMRGTILCDGPSSMTKLALTAIELNNRGNKVRDGARNSKLATVFASLDPESKGEVLKLQEAVKLKAQDMVGITAPLGFFDPLGFSTNVPAGKLLFYREVELKHGRVGMLASLGLLVGEMYHPLFGGNIDVPSYKAFQETPLAPFWVSVVSLIAIPERSSVESFAPPLENGLWMIKEDHIPGDLGFDPLGLKPVDPKEFRDMQNKELNNGRLAMIAAAGIIAQELATGKKIL